MSRSSRRWLVPLLLAPVLFAAACNSESSLEAGDDTATSNEVSDTTANDGSRSPVTLGSSTSTDPSSSVQSSVPTSIAGSGSGGTPTTRPRSGGGGGSGSRATTPTAVTGTKSQTIEFPTVSGPWAFGESRALPALATSGLKVTLAATGACQVTNPDLGVLTATDVGECRVTASQSGGSGFTAAPSVTRTAQISKATPRIEGFGDQSVEYLREFFTVPLTATATGGAPVLYRLLGPSDPDAPCALQGNTIEINNFIQDTPTSCFIEAYVDASRQFEAASARATITITPTVVNFTGHRLESFDPAAGTATVSVTLNRDWGISPFAPCGDPTEQFYQDASFYTVTFNLTTIPTPTSTCTLSIDLDFPDGAFTPDHVEFTIPIP